MKRKKGQYTLQSLAPLAVAFVVIAIVIGIGADILQNIQDGQTESTDISWNASYYGLQSMETFSSWLPTLAIVVVAAVVIGVIATYFAFGGGRR